jgi:hypothetical protein
MKTLWRDLRYGFRLLGKNRGFAAVAVLALALGIGRNTAIFSVLYATLLAPLPYPEPNQLVVVWSKIGGGRNVVSAGDFLDWKREAKAFQGMAAWTGFTANLAGSEGPEQVPGTRAFGVEQRTHEIGLRMALGAGRNEVLGLVLREGLAMAAAGLALGLSGAWLVGRAMQSVLYGIAAFDAKAFGAVAALLLLSALAACYLPALRATGVDPMAALREE